MQTKTIRQNIAAKLIEWISTIADTTLQRDLKENIVCSGGAAAAMYLKEPVNDYDVYIQDRGVLMRLVKYYAAINQNIMIMDGHEKEKLVDDLEDRYRKSPFQNIELIRTCYSIALQNLKDDQIKLFFLNGRGGLKIEPVDMTEKKSALIALEKYNDKILNDLQSGHEYEKKTIDMMQDELKSSSEAIINLKNELKKSGTKYQPAFFSPNAISLTDQLQIVIRFHGTPEQIHKTFDFIHPTNYFTFKDGLVINLAAMESLMTKQLKYQGSMYPVTSIIRVRKFVKRGWNVNAGELLKIMFQISTLDLTDPNVLEEQLIGVDIAYFEALINALRKCREREDFTLTPEYFNELVDRIFNDSPEHDEPQQ